MRNAAGMLFVDEHRVRLAVEFYTAFPDEIDARITSNEKAAERLRERAECRLLA